MWGRTVDAGGLTNDLFFLLCDSFRYCAAKPLFDFYKRSSTETLPYQALGSYKAMRENHSEIVLRMHMSLLAHELLCPTSAEQIAALMRRIPADAINKEGRLSGRIQSYFVTLMVSELSGRSLEVKGMDFSGFESDIRSFARFAAPILNEIGCAPNRSKAEQNAIIDLLAWLDSYSEKKAQGLSAPKNEAPLLQEERKNTASYKEPSDAKTSGAAHDELSVGAVLNFISSQNKKLEAALSSQAVLIAENTRLKESGKTLEERIASLENSLESARSNNSDLKNQLSQMEEKAEKLEASLAESRQMVELLNSSNVRKKDESLVRLAQSLAPDYEDYRNSLEEDMSLDLGENLRDMLGEVFKALKKAGIEL